LTLEIIAIAAGVAFALWGLFKGVVLHGFSLLGIFCAMVFAPFLGNILVQGVFKHFAWPILKEEMTLTVSVFLFGTLIYTCIFGIGIKFHRKHIKKRPILKGLDRFAGAILGFFIGGFLVFLVARLFGKA
jgi:uncharacterized membrane protein required for colicin V production